jgi:hypothetical protein
MRIYFASRDAHRRRRDKKPPDSHTRRSDGNCEEEELGEEVVLEVSKEVDSEEELRQEESSREKEIGNKAHAECGVHEADDAERTAGHCSGNGSASTH